MADVQMPKTIPCKFNARGWAPCKKPSDNGWCSEHEDLKCVSCGKKATQSCDAGIGGLACGARLCSSCKHKPYGLGHVTDRMANEICQARLDEEEATKASRSSLVQRFDKLIGCPVNLFELLKGDSSEYEIKQGFYLELKHDLMGFFPAIFADELKRIVVTLDKGLILKVLETLSPRRYSLRESLFYVVEKFDVAYPHLGESGYNRESSVPQRYLTEEEFNLLTAEEGKPFRWAPGLIGNDMSAEDLLETFKSIQKAIS
mgnify:CR=1 FL=1